MILCREAEKGGGGPQWLGLRTVIYLNLTSENGLAVLFAGEERPDDRNYDYRYDEADKDQSAAGFDIIHKTVVAGTQYQRIGRRAYRGS